MIVILPRSRPFIDIQQIFDTVFQQNDPDPDSIADFEREFSNYLGSPLAIATNQGRAALLLALRALQIGQGDEVLVQSFTYQGVIDAILNVGATPVLVDNSKTDLNLDVTKIVDSITPQTKAIIATHLFGVPCNIEDIVKIARERGCYCIEDCAQSLGAKYNHRMVGSFGDCAFFSFNFEKHMTTGEGGMLIVNNRELLSRFKTYSQTLKRASVFNEQAYIYGMLLTYAAFDRMEYRTELTAYFGQDLCKKDAVLFQLINEMISKGSNPGEFWQRIMPYVRTIIDRQSKPSLKKTLHKFYTPVFQWVRERVHRDHYNYIDPDTLLMNNLRAAVGRINLRKVTEINEVRNNHARSFFKMLQGSSDYILPDSNPLKNPAYLKVCLLNQTDVPTTLLYRKAKERGFEIGNFQWPKPVHMLRPYTTHMSYNRVELVVSEYISQRILNIPIHWNVTEIDLSQIYEILTERSSNRR